MLFGFYLCKSVFRNVHEMDRVELKSRTVFCEPLHERAVKRNVKQGGQKHLRTGAGAIDCQAKTLIPSNLRTGLSLHHAAVNEHGGSPTF